MQAVGSTLEVACDHYIGRKLVVEPHYGYGWVHQEGNPFAKTQGVPPPFHLRIVRIYTYNEERRGVLARITEPHFLYDGFWLVSMTRHQGLWNFTDRPANYNLLLCPEEPLEGKPEDSPDYGKLWPVWHLRGYPHASGFGRIAESLQWCADFDAKRDAKARQQAEQDAANDGGSDVRFLGTIVSERNRHK